MKEAQAAQIQTSMASLAVHQPVRRVIPTSSSCQYASSTQSSNSGLRQRRRPGILIDAKQHQRQQQQLQWCNNKKNPIISFADRVDNDALLSSDRIGTDILAQTKVIDGLEPDWRLHHKPLTHKMMNEVMKKAKGGNQSMQQAEGSRAKGAAAAGGTAAAAGDVICLNEESLTSTSLYQGRRKRKTRLVSPDEASSSHKDMMIEEDPLLTLAASMIPAAVD